MAPDIDRQTVLAIIQLHDAARAAEARRVAARGGSANCEQWPDEADMLPAPLTPEDQLLHDRLAELGDHTMSRVLAMYWLGRQASWEPVDEQNYRVLLAHAEDNLDHAACYLTVKPDLGKSLWIAVAILGL
jgi:hypothetical protein